MRTITPMCALLGALACSGTSTAPADEPAQKRYAAESTEPDYTAPADCGAELAAIRSILEKLEPVIPEQLDVFAPTVARAEIPTKRGAVVGLVRGQIRLDRFPITKAQLKQRLVGKVRYGVPLYIYADGRTPASEILAVIGEAPPAVESHLVVKSRAAPFPWDVVRPNASAGWATRMFGELRAAAEAGDDDARDQLGSTLMTTALGTCRAAVDAFAPHAAKPSSRDARRLAEPLLAAVESCNCAGVEIAGLKLAIPALMSRHNELGTVPLARLETMRLQSTTTANNLALMLTPRAPD